MLGFGQASFMARGSNKDAQKGKKEKEQRRGGAGKRFLVQRQGYLRSSRRILEMSEGSLWVLDLQMTIRHKFEVSDVTAVKIGADDGTFILEMRKGSEAFFSARRAELLCILLPIVQGNVGGQLFSLCKWSKRMLFQGKKAETGRGYVTFRVWSGKLTVVTEEMDKCGCEVLMHDIGRIVKLSDAPDDVLLMLRSTSRLLRFSCHNVAPTQGGGGKPHFSARDRLVRAIADSSLAQLGLTIPVEEALSEDVLSSFRERIRTKNKERKGEPLHQVLRLSVTCKPRLLEVTKTGVVERDETVSDLIHRELAWKDIAYVVLYDSWREEAESRAAPREEAEAAGGDRKSVV